MHHKCTVMMTTLHLSTRARHWFWMQEAGPQLRWPGGQLGWAGGSARRHMAGTQVSRLGQCSCQGTV